MKQEDFKMKNISNKKMTQKKSGIEKDIEKISKQILALPMFPTLHKEEMDYIIDTIAKFFEYTNK